jgi:hypothetical protein
MVDTPNLGVTHPEVGQAGKEPLIGAGFDRLDTSNNDTIDFAMPAGGGAIVLPSAAYLDNWWIRLTGSPSAASTLSVPDGKRVVGFENMSGQQVTIQTDTADGDPVVLQDGEKAVLASRGTELDAVARFGPGSLTATTASGASVTVPIPAWATIIHFSWLGFSADAADEPRLRVKNSGGAVSSGYLGTVEQGGSGADFSAAGAFELLVGAAAATAYSIRGTLQKYGDGDWALSSIGRDRATTTATHIAAGEVSFSGPITDVEFTLNGAGNFDAGKLVVSWQ